MIALLRDAHATRDALMSGRDETIDAMAQRLGIKRDILSAQMRLTYLAPDIVRALVHRRPSEGLTPAGLLSLCKDLPHASRFLFKGDDLRLVGPAKQIAGAIVDSEAIVLLVTFATTLDLSRLRDGLRFTPEALHVIAADMVAPFVDFAEQPTLEF